MSSRPPKGCDGTCPVDEWQLSPEGRFCLAQRRRILPMGCLLYTCSNARCPRAVLLASHHAFDRRIPHPQVVVAKEFELRRCDGCGLMVCSAEPCSFEEPTPPKRVEQGEHGLRVRCVRCLSAVGTECLHASGDKRMLTGQEDRLYQMTIFAGLIQHEQRDVARFWEVYSTLHNPRVGTRPEHAISVYPADIIPAPEDVVRPAAVTMSGTVAENPQADPWGDYARIQRRLTMTTTSLHEFRQAPTRCLRAIFGMGIADMAGRRDTLAFRATAHGAYQWYARTVQGWLSARW